MSTSPYACGFAWRKRCAKCRQFKAMTGGHTSRGGRAWVCKDCKPKKREAA